MFLIEAGATLLVVAQMAESYSSVLRLVRSKVFSFLYSKNMSEAFSHNMKENSMYHVQAMQIS